jgi:hypothetical protein
MRMYYFVVAKEEVESATFFGGERSGLLVLGERGQVLPVFYSFGGLIDFVEALYPEDSKGFAACPVGPTLFEVAEEIRLAMEAGEIERVVFDPVVDFTGEWSGQAMDWPAMSLCEFLEAVHPVVVEMAGGKLILSEDDDENEAAPHPHDVYQALRRCMKQLCAYLDED